MKFFVAFALIVAVASAGVARNNFIDPEVQQIGQIIAAIESPSTDPATAQLLEQMLLEALGQNVQVPVAVGPAIVEGIPPSPVSVIEGPSPISIEPAIVEEPFPIAPAPVVEVPAPVAPAPVAEVPAPAAPAQSSSLVQIIVNVNAEAAPGVHPVSVNEPAPVAPAPVAEVEQVKPTPVSVVEGEGPAAVAPAPVVLPAPVSPVVVEPISVVEPALPVVVSPIQVAEPALPAPVVVSPIQVAEPALPAPVVVSPVQVAEPNPVVGGAAPVVLPGQLN